MSKAFNRETNEYDFNAEDWCVGCLWETTTGTCIWGYTIENCKILMKEISDPYTDLKKNGLIQDKGLN